MIMLFISCFVFLLKETVSIYPRPREDKKNLPIELPIETKKQCPATYSRSLLFVSTVDGRLTCINAKNGNSLWSFDLNEPLVSSTISYIQSGADLSQATFIPSLDGTLFKWNGQYVESQGLSTDYLIGQMKKLPDGSFLVGGTNTAIYGIDIDSGKVLYESSGRGCKPTRKGKFDEKYVVSLRRSQHVVRAVNRVDGHENWNYSVGRYEMELAEDEIELNTNTLCDQDNIDLHFNVQDGLIVNSGTSSWSFKVDSPITDAWQLEKSSLKPVDIFKHGLFENIEDFSEPDYTTQSFMFLGTHEGQMYIQKSLDIQGSKARLYSGKRSQPQIDVSKWRPMISTSPSRTPSLNNKPLAALSTLDYPFDNGYILISNTTPTAVSIVEDNQDETENVDYCDTNGRNCDFAQPNPGIPTIESVPLKDRWKEILILSILIAVGINLGVKFVNKKFKSSDTLTPFQDFTTKENIAVSDVIEGENKRKKTASASKLDSKDFDFDTVTHISTGYDSRYIDDFEHLECLGKGGFGVVFKAKKKIDDCDYAIKRIFLPRCDEAKSKMMREVKALAALDHPGIVRYFHAWWEEPPQDWQKTTDKTYLMKDHTTSYGLSQDWVLEVEGSNSPSKTTFSEDKRKSDDPLGKRFNFDTGVEEFISDHLEFDLLKHNDVFYPDEHVDVSNEPNEDSFDIVFESNRSGEAQSFVHMSHRLSKVNNVNELSISEQDEGIEENDYSMNEERKDYSRKGRTRKRLVCKCCAQNSSCLTRPPLFLYIQMQLCKQETLKDWLKSKTDGLYLVESMAIFMEIVSAVEYFHDLGLMHRDLKPANILFSLDGHVKVGDFGLVTAITRPSVGKRNFSIEDENHTGQVGTQLYMSPEQVSGKPYCQKVDIYSLGLIFFELIYSFSTQMERMQVLYRLKQGVIPSELISTPQGKLVEILTAEDPELRPNASEITDHIFITEINNNINNISSVRYNDLIRVPPETVNI